MTTKKHYKFKDDIYVDQLLFNFFGIKIAR
jgi:hypothetical protein